MNLFIKVCYNLADDKFKYESNIKKGQMEEIVLSFLRQQIGKGADNSERNEVDIYEISIELDLSDDTFYCSHNCGNLGLRDGILMHFVSRELL